jgi:signal transduction histidine kinase
MKTLDRGVWQQGRWLDMGIAGVYSAVALLELALSSQFEGIVDAWLLIFILMQTAVIGWRRRFPFASHLIALLGLALQANGYPLGVSTNASLFTMYSVAAYGSWWQAGAAGAVTMADVVWVITRLPVWDNWDLITTGALWLAVAILGVFSRLQQIEAERRTRQLARLERDRRQFRRDVVAAERARMARELHDSVGHSVTGIVLLAGAIRTAGDDPQVVHDAVGAIECSGLDALAELDAVVGLLRDEDEHSDFARQPGLRNLDRLLGNAKDVGLEVETAIDHLDYVPPSIDRAAFRIVQESLTNASRYANPANVALTIRSKPDAIEITVENPVMMTPAPSALSSGRGLIGMDERLSILGGTFAAGPTKQGTFRVVATLPTRHDASDLVAGA